jgi:TatD DNase family protein
MNVDRRGSREGKKTSLRQTNKAKKHVTTAVFTPSSVLFRTTPPTLPTPQVHPEALFDCGCNLVNRQFDTDFQRVVTRSVKYGVEGLIILPNDFEKISNAIALCKWQPGVLYCAAGIHPNNIVAKKMSDKQYLQTLQQLREYLVNPEVVALFCGLDYARDVGLKAPQEKFLNSQLKLAGELGLPVIFLLSPQSFVFQSLLEIIKECRGDFKNGLVHNFYGTEEQLKLLLELDLHVSISGAITDSKYIHLKMLIEKIPKEKLLLCSDSPYLTPKNILDEHVRESRNEPSNMPSVLQACAQLLNLTTKELASVIRANTIEFFDFMVPQQTVALAEASEVQGVCSNSKAEREILLHDNKAVQSLKEENANQNKSKPASKPKPTAKDQYRPEVSDEGSKSKSSQQTTLAGEKKEYGEPPKLAVSASEGNVLTVEDLTLANNNR